MLLLLLTVFESMLVSMPVGMERLSTFLLLILPPAVGAVLGALSLIRRDGQMWLGVTGIVLNSLFAIFHLMIVLFAG